MRQTISALAIILGLTVHGRFLFILIADSQTDGEGWGLLVIPAYSFLTSLVLYGVLGLFDLNKIKRGQTYLWTVTIISTFTLLMGGLYMPLREYTICALIFIGLNTLPFMIKRGFNLNMVPFTINILTLLVTPLSFGTF
jgi:hypothetical protein